MNEVKDVNGGELAEAIDGGGKVLVDFWAPWCGPCRALGPVLDSIAEDSDAKIVKVNVDEEPAAAEKFCVRAVPTLVAFEDGDETSRNVGAMSATAVKEMIE